MPDSSQDEIQSGLAAELTDVKPSTESSAADVSGDTPDKGDTGDMLSAVKAALKPKEEDSPTSDGTDPKSEADTDADKPDESEKAGEGDDEFTEEEYSQLKTKTRRQFEKRNQRIGDLTSELETTKPRAEQFDKIVQFVEEAGLIPQEVNDLFDIGRNLKADPRKAYDQIKPVYEQLQRMFGDILPDDLQTQVNQGYLTEAHARQLASSRTDAEIANSQADRLRQRQERETQERTTQGQVDAVKGKVTDWETSKEKSDPDWNLKQPDVMQAIKLALMERQVAGKPLPSEAEAVEIADKALSEVNAKVARYIPKRKEVKAVTDAGSTPSTHEPTSALEAARAGLAQARTG